MRLSAFFSSSSYKNEEMMSCHVLAGPYGQTFFKETKNITSRMSSSSFHPKAVERLKRRVTWQYTFFFSASKKLKLFRLFPFDSLYMLLLEECTSFSRSWIIHHVFSFLFTLRIILCLLCIPDVVDGGKAEEYGQKVSFFLKQIQFDNNMWDMFDSSYIYYDGIFLEGIVTQCKINKDLRKMFKKILIRHCTISHSPL